MLIHEEGDFAISIGVAIAFGLVALFAMATVAMTKSEISSGLTSDIESGLKSFGDFIVKSVTETIVMTCIPYMLTFVALDNVMMSKKANTNPNKRPERKKQGREEGNKARYKDNWESRNNYRNPRKRKKHTLGKDHRKFFKVILLFLLSKGLERF